LEYYLILGKMVLDLYILREGGALEEEVVFQIDIGDVDGLGSGVPDSNIKWRKGASLVSSNSPDVQSQLQRDSVWAWLSCVAW
jgi:hypothetical protein